MLQTVGCDSFGQKWKTGTGKRYLTDRSTQALGLPCFAFYCFSAVLRDRCWFSSVVALTATVTRNSSGDEIANVNFLYDDIVHALKIQ